MCSQSKTLGPFGEKHEIKILLTNYTWILYAPSELSQQICENFI